MKRALVLFLALPIALAACVKGSDSTTSSPNPNSGFQARFEPLSGIMPFPNDLYFNGSTTGTLNIPALDPTLAANASILALNHLDGFGTQSVINAYFTSAVAKSSLNAGDVIVLQVTTDPSTKAITGFVKPLVEGTDYSVGISDSADSGGTVLNITPLKPLAGGSSYLVVLTTGIKDSAGAAVTPSTDYAAILAADAPALAAGADPTKIDASALPDSGLLPVAQFTLAQLAVAAGAGIDTSKIALTFSFSTQYTDVTLPAMAAAAAATTQPSGVGIVDTGLTVADAITAAGQTPPAPAALAELYAGTVALPYYSPVPTTNDPTAPLTGYWQYNNGTATKPKYVDVTVSHPVPTATVEQNVIPILVSIPNSASGCTMPGTGWKTVIFQHGITQNRENMLAVAGSFASQCFAVVAIDLPLHGVTDTTDPLYVKDHERTFDLPPSDGSSGIASSGSYFINLQSLITSRDNLREGVADLINLTATLPALVAVDSPTTPTVFNTFDASQIYFVGHSLGAIVGTTFLGVDGSKIVAATLANPGGDISQLLLNSPSFAPSINAGLESQGVQPGTQFYDDFFRNAQSVIEDGDPANYAAAATANTPIHMLEVVGGFDPYNVADTVVPNSSTDLLISLMGLQSINTVGFSPVATGIGNGVVVKFTAGDHGSILDPSVPSGVPSSEAAVYGGVTTEMQSEAVSLAASNGTVVGITDNTYIKH